MAEEQNKLREIKPVTQEMRAKLEDIAMELGYPTYCFLAFDEIGVRNLSNLRSNVDLVNMTMALANMISQIEKRCTKREDG